VFGFQVSVAVPVTNSLKFVTTFIAGQILGETKLNPKVGMFQVTVTTLS
jgi:hypothetical protein